MHTQVALSIKERLRQMLKIFKKKPKLKRVMVYKKVIECSKFYLAYNFRTYEREVKEKWKK